VRVTIEDLTRARIRLVLAFLCVCASAWLYHALIRLVPQIGSAEPTGVGEAVSHVKLLTHKSLQSIQHRTHGFGYAGRYMACCAGLFALYGVMLWLAKGIRSRWFIALSGGASAFFMGMQLLSPAMLSSDTYAYAYYGRLLAFYGVNAHSPAPHATLTDPFLSGGWYQFVPSVYGPLWTVISGSIVLLGGGHVGLTLLMFRALEAAAVLGCGGFIWVILNRLSPAHAAQGTVLFLWNPLVIIESGLSGHNDTCMMFFALLAVWLHLRGSKAASVIAMTLSALVKVITAPLVPLYMLMILRRSSGWKERARFLGRAGLGAGAAVALSMLCARMSPSGLTLHTASTAQFFENNYHELLFKGLRRLLGEPADTIQAPMDFRPYWVATNGPAVLRAGISNKTADLCRLKTGQELLLISDEDSDDWMRVYDPADRMQGYVDWPHLTVIDNPPIADTDPTVRRLSGWPPDWPTVVKANQLIRVTTWSLFIAFGLLAAWKTTDFDAFLTWSTAFFLASQLLVFTKIWPWYAVWPLAFGALKPRSAATRLAIMLSAGMIIIYVLFDYSSSDRWSWVNDYRSIPTIVLPVVLFAILQWSTRSALVLPILSGTLPAGKRAANPSPGPESEGFKER
jgi:hypothetical protein